MIGSESKLVAHQIQAGKIKLVHVQVDVQVLGDEDEDRYDQWFPFSYEVRGKVIGCE